MMEWIVSATAVFSPKWNLLCGSRAHTRAYILDDFLRKKEMCAVDSAIIWGSKQSINIEKMQK